MITRTEDTAWKLIDEYFEKAIRPNEAIKTVWEYTNCGRRVAIQYSRIESNKLTQNRFHISMELLRALPEKTVLIIMGDILDLFRLE